MLALFRKARRTLDTNNPSQVNFKNTTLALERVGEILDDVPCVTLEADRSTRGRTD
jgi:hypothetical protein